MSPTIPKANLIWHVTWDITESMKRLGPKSSNSGWKKKGKRVREKDLYACLRETKRWENQRWREQEREIETERGRGGQREGVAHIWPITIVSGIVICSLHILFC